MVRTTTPIRMGTLAAALFLLAGCDDGPARPGIDRPEDPLLVIEAPAWTQGIPAYLATTIFRWRPAETEPPAAVRHLFTMVTDTAGAYDPGFDIVGDLASRPDRYENRWSRWIAWEAPGDSARMTVIGDDETPVSGRVHFFAVQARDGEGHVTRTFSTGTNARLYRVGTSKGPFLTIREPSLGAELFVGDRANPAGRELPPGAALRFGWRADASSYGGEIAGFRHGWDVPDFDAWTAPFDPADTRSATARFHAGTHVFAVEALDQAGKITRGRFEIVVVPFPMDRPLLWVDDLYSTAGPFPDFSFPAEPDHDAFWLGLLSRATGFDPLRDVYDTDGNRFLPPGADLLGRYRNVVWTFGTSGTAWERLVRFTPESAVGSSAWDEANLVSFFLRRGGHLLSVGFGDRGGGLAAALPPASRIFPMSLSCEIAGTRNDCDGDRSGAESMPAADGCVTVLDKVLGSFRGDPRMPARILDRHDVMVGARRDASDPVNARYPLLPARLPLWSEAVAEGRWFSPDSAAPGPGGLPSVEIFDPPYWMDVISASSAACFHPMYRMTAFSSSSAVDGCAVALWLTRYEDVIADAPGATAAPSAHIGFPLWFIERAQADSLTSAVFDAWGILVSPAETRGGDGR
ncbi:MAG: hypothetical protein JW876_02450 [Candidatus Krumholzibacteriota bacterium]|nr:hypothetical protein [Candidatus Krumholzibacteriota bacterium]